MLLILFNPGECGDFLAGLLNENLVVLSNGKCLESKYVKCHRLDDLIQGQYQHGSFTTILIDHKQNLDSILQIAFNYYIKNKQIKLPNISGKDLDSIYGTCIDYMFEDYQERKESLKFDYIIDFKDLFNINYLKRLFVEINQRTMPSWLLEKIKQYYQLQLDYKDFPGLCNIKKVLEFELENKLLQFQAIKYYNFEKEIHNIDKFLDIKNYKRTTEVYKPNRSDAEVRAMYLAANDFVRHADIHYDYNSIYQSIECYSMGLLTYIRTLKTGSTFFNDLFKRIWFPCDLKTLDYRQTRAFGYIGDPIARRAKGIAEWIVQRNLSSQFISNKVFRTSILNAPCLDMHTASLFDLFGDHCYITDWIPVDYEDHDFAKGQTEFLLTQYKIFMINWDLTKVHRGNNLYKQVEKIALEEMQTHLEPLVVNYLYKDISLFNKVIENFDPEAETWEKRSWLTIPK